MKYMIRFLISEYQNRQVYLYLIIETFQQHGTQTTLMRVHVVYNEHTSRSFQYI